MFSYREVCSPVIAIALPPGQGPVLVSAQAVSQPKLHNKEMNKIIIVLCYYCSSASD